MEEIKNQLINANNEIRWFKGSPLAVCCANLYRNPDSDELFANIKFINIQPEKLKSITFDIICYGIIRNEISRIENYTLEHLSVERNECFGDANFIKIENPETMAIDVILKSAVDFEDEEWINEETQPFNITLKQNNISSYMGRHFGKLKDLWTEKGLADERLLYAPLIKNDYWLCSCGTFNWNMEEICCKCGVELNWLEENTDVSALNREEEFLKRQSEKAEKSVTLVHEMPQSINQPEQQTESAVNQESTFPRKHKKRTRILTTFSIFLIVFAIAAFGIYCFLTPANNYYSAISLIDQGQYDQAIKALKLLDGYGDSQQQLYRAKYLKAENLQQLERYNEAASIFKEIKDYNNSSEKYNECMYQYAEQKYSDKEYIEALKIFTDLRGYKDSVKKAEKAEKAVFEIASKLLENKKYSDASSEFLKIYNITKNAKALEQSNAALLKKADNLYSNYRYVDAIQIYESLSGYAHVDATLKKLDSLRKILSTSVHMENDSSVWECDKQTCSVCHIPETLSYEFVFRKNGTYEFKRYCPNHSGEPANITLSGQYKIEDNIIYDLRHNGGSTEWVKLSEIENITSENTNPNKNAKMVITNPFTEDDSTIILYGNVVDEKSSLI